MARVTIRIDTDGDAFYLNEGGELARILVELTRRIEGEDDLVAFAEASSARLRDLNGNVVGGMVVTDG